MAQALTGTMRRRLTQHAQQHAGQAGEVRQVRRDEASSRQEKANNLRAEVVKLAKLVEDPETGDEVFSRYLTWMATFHSFSFGNSMLIMSQRPSASLVAGYRQWQERGRQVRAGEKGIAILVPMTRKVRADDLPALQVGEEEVDAGRVTYFGVGYVFDVAQTSGDEPLLNFKRELADSEALLAGAIRGMESSGIAVQWADLGACNGTSSGGVVTLNSAAPRGVLAQTALHEWAHELLHHGPNRGELARSLREGEAEAVCVVVLRGLGWDVSSGGAAYIRNHGATGADVRASLERIAATASKVLADLGEVGQA